MQIYDCVTSKLNCVKRLKVLSIISIYISKIVAIIIRKIGDVFCIEKFRIKLKIFKQFENYRIYPHWNPIRLKIDSRFFSYLQSVILSAEATDVFLTCDLR